MSANRFHELDLSRRQLLGGMALFAGVGVAAAATLVAPAATAGSKFSQKMAQYQPMPKGNQRCQNCSQFQAPTACAVVDGSVSGAGWCQLYAPK